MVIESQGKQDCYNEQDSQHQRFINTQQRQSNEVSHQNYQFRDHNVCQDCADKESLLALEKHATGGATLSYPVRSFDDRRLAASRTAQGESAR
jgi:recombinational DNA repair protein RecR